MLYKVLGWNAFPFKPGTAFPRLKLTSWIYEWGLKIAGSEIHHFTMRKNFRMKLI